MIYYHEDTRGANRLISEIETRMAEKLPFLDNIFGKAERVCKTYNGKRYYTPCWYDQRNEYISLLPDEGLGTFSFFTLDEPQEIEMERGGNTTYKIPINLIVWLDFNTMQGTTFPTNGKRNTEAVKEEILRTFNRGIFLQFGKIKFTQVYERVENVYKGFNLDEVDNMFMMHPFGALRFTGIIEFEEECINA